MRILVVEDDAMVAQAIQALLIDQRYSVDIAADGLEGLAMAEAYTYDLMVLDVGLPQLDGISLCQQLRAQAIQTPILLLTGQAVAAQAKATALNAGADDYVTKPFEAEELLARVQSLLRRGNLNTPPILRWGTLCLDPSRLQVSYGDTLLQLTPKEYALLEVLLRQAPNIVSSAMMLEQCWNALDVPGEEVVRYHLKELRKKLKAAGAPEDFIKTVHRQGYRLNPLYGEATFSTEEESTGTLPTAELKAVNEELRQTLEQLQATQAELQQRNQESQAAQDELEQRVAERTTELTANLAALELLQSLSNRFVPNGDLQALYEEILTAAIRLTGAEGGMLQILDVATQELVLLASVGFDATMTDHYARVSAGSSTPCGMALAAGQRTFVEFDVPESEDSKGDCRRHREAGFLSAQSTPLISRLGRPIGMISTHWRTRHRPSDRELRFLDLLARQAADLIEQRQTYAVLRQSEEKFRLFVNASSDIVYRMSADWREMRRLEGKHLLLSTEAPRDDWLEFYVPPAEQTRVRAAIQKAIRTHQFFELEHQVICHDGSIGWVFSRALPLLNEQGDIVEWLGTAIDITDRQRIAVALQASEAKFRHLIELVPQIVWTTDDQRHTYISPQVSEYSGIAPEQLYSFDWRTIIHPDDIDLVHARWQESVSTGVSYEVEYRLRRRDGEYRWHQAKAVPIQNEQGRQWFGASTDIHDLKQTKLALQASQHLAQQQLAEIETIYQSIPIGLNVLDRDLRFVRINQRLADMNGLPIEAHLGRTVREVLPDLADRAEQLLRPILATGEPLLNVEISGETPAQPGVKRTWIESFLPLKEGDRIMGINTVCEEITDRKQAEAALQASEAKYRSLFNEIDEGYCIAEMIVNDSGVPVDYRILEANPRFAQLTALSLEIALSGRTIREIAPELEEHWYQIYGHVALTGEPIRFEQQAAGWNRWYDVYAFRIGEPELRQVAILFNDISDRKQSELTLQQQIRQEQLLADIAQEIRQSLELEQVLHSTVDRVREWLGCDRVVIFRFRPNWQGDVIMESVSNEHIAIQSTTIVDPCFEEQFIEPYCQGHVSVLNDIHQPDLEPCYVELLQQFQVQASLAVPIFQGDDLWGLLIAHQCAAPRQWQAAEIAILQRLSTQVGIAIQQAELYEQIHRELAQRAQMQTVLQESEERFRTLSAAAPVGILQTNVDGICLYANDTWQQMSGLTLQHSLGNGWLQAVHPEDRVWVSQAWEDHIEHQLGGQAEFRLLTPDQEIRWISARVAAIKSATDDIVGFVSTFENITERQQAEEALRESEQRLQGILDHSPAIIYVLNPQNQNLLVNHSYANLLSTTPDCLIGKDIWELWPTELADRFAAQNRIILETGQLLQIEDTLPLADGIHSFITVKFPLYDATGNPYAVCGISTDITEQKHLEAQFYQAQRLESLGTLAGGIAHDLNNVLTPILTVAQMLQLTQQGLDAKGLERLKLIETSAKRGANLVKQILTVTRASQGERTVVDLAALLQEEVGIMQQSFPKAIQIQADLPPPDESPPALGMLLADPTYLHQIILNLCVNARDAMPDGGTLTLSAEPVFVDEAMAAQNLDAQVGHYAVVTVADTGVGIPIAVQERMFDPFFTTKPSGQGTGLGLATVRGLVKANEGFLQVFSQEGRGSQFKVYLPLMTPAEAAPAPLVPLPATTAAPQGQGVLLVEDEEIIRSLLQSLLEGERYRVILAQDGAAAIEQYRQQRSQIQLVITDITMPRVDGIALIRDLKALNPEVKILALSGVSTHKETALAAGADDFVTKPFEIEIFLSRIAALLRP